MSPKKALVLGTLLLVPVLVFLFLSLFGVNKFSLRTYFPTKVDSTLVQGAWQYDTTYHQVADFQLTSLQGDNFSHQDLKGNVYVAHFFSTPCTGQCKLVVTQLARVQDAFRFKPDVKIVSFTNTTSQDSAIALNQFAENLKVDVDRWFFLTGPENQIQMLAKTGFMQSSINLAESNSSLITNEKLFLVDKQRHIRGIYDGSDAKEIDRLITELNVLISMYEQDNAN
jgi:protein SCO1